MNKSIRVRLDSKSSKALASLRSRLGWSDSKIVSEGLKMMAAHHLAPFGHAIIGLGKFSSRKSDLGSNKKNT
jgi:hypothetical protein